MVPDGAPRPPDRASAWCSPGGCPASKQPRGQAIPARVCEEPEGRGLRRKQRCPLEGSCPPRPLRESAESRPTAAASATRLGHEGCGLGSVSETPRGTPTLLCPTRSSESSLPGSPALPGSECQPASRPHTLAPHAHPGLGAEAGLRLFRIRGDAAAGGDAGHRPTRGRPSGQGQGDPSWSRRVSQACSWNLAPHCPQASASLAGARKSTAREQKLQAGDLSKRRARREPLDCDTLGRTDGRASGSVLGRGQRLTSPSQIGVARAFTQRF